MIYLLALWILHLRIGDALHFDLTLTEINHTTISRHTFTIYAPLARL